MFVARLHLYKLIVSMNKVLIALFVLLSFITNSKAQNDYLRITTKSGTVMYYNVEDFDSLCFVGHMDMKNLGHGIIGAHTYVDLALPSGTKWATVNIGADSPEDYGSYFAFGETAPKTDYSRENYQYATQDAARTLWGPDWHIPTSEQIEELYNADYTVTQWTTVNGVYGKLVTSKQNGCSIFLPAAGYSIGSHTEYVGECGNYWTSKLYENYYSTACYLYFNPSAVCCDKYFRYAGFTVRPVAD